MASRILSGKLGIVTGASRGIGAAIAENLASKGCNLVLNYTSKSSTALTKELSQKLESKWGIRTFAVQADLGTIQGPSALIAATKDQFLAAPPTANATFQIDIVVNNAGVAKNDKLPDVKPDDFDYTFHVNVRGPLLLMQAVAPYLPHDRSGRIVNLSSIPSSPPPQPHQRQGPASPSSAAHARSTP